MPKFIAPEEFGGPKQDDGSAPRGQPRATAELREGTAHLEEDGRNLEGILCQGLLRTERPRREQQDVKAGREDVADTPAAWPVPAYGYERVESGVDALGQWQNDAPVVWRLDASTSVYLRPDASASQCQ